MKKLYKYTGTISSFSYRRSNPNTIPFSDIILFDLYDDNKAPVKIEAMGGLADYLHDIEWTDAEERYISSDWYYDRNLCLHRIEIPSGDPRKPAKIIAQHDAIDQEVTIFGQSEYIESRKTEPMDNDQLRAWYQFRSEDEYRYPHNSDGVSRPWQRKEH